MSKKILISDVKKPGAHAGDSREVGDTDGKGLLKFKDHPHDLRTLLHEIVVVDGKATSVKKAE